VKAGRYSILVQDAADHRTIVELNVTDGSKEGKPAMPPREEEAPHGGDTPVAASQKCPTPKDLLLDDFEKGLTDVQVWHVQRAVGAAADGIVGDATRARICAYQEQTGKKQTGRVDQLLFVELKKKSDQSPMAAKALNPFERSYDFTVEKLRQIQAKLGVDQSGEFDLATRSAIETFQAPAGVARPEKPQELSAALVQAILDS
jgi:hypothetical protein